MDAHHDSANAAGPRSTGEPLERRLSEAWQSLWDNLVDPRESYWDDGPGWIGDRPENTAGSGLAEQIRGRIQGQHAEENDVSR